MERSWVTLEGNEAVANVAHAMSEVIAIYSMPPIDADGGTGRHLVRRRTSQSMGNGTMFQRILVPLDGTTHAEQALPVAARIARASGGSIVLLQVADAPAEYEGLSKFPSPITEENT